MLRLFTSFFLLAAVTAAVSPGLSAQTGSSADSCQDLATRMTILQALRETEPASLVAGVKKIVSRRDQCSVPYRRDALQYLPKDLSSGAEAVVILVATTDPEKELRMTAMQMLRADSSDAAVQAFAKVLSDATDDAVAQSALSALAGSRNPGGRKAIRDFVALESTSEEWMGNGIQYLSPSNLTYIYSTTSPYGYYGQHGGKVTKEDSLIREARGKESAGYLRELYSKMPSERLKSQIISAVAQYGGSTNASWLLTIVTMASEPLELKKNALYAATSIPVTSTHGFWYGANTAGTGISLGIDELTAVYDKTNERTIKSTLIEIYARRSEDAAFTKLGSIAKSDKDQTMRQQAVRLLTASSDPRAKKALQGLFE
jgi:hypothetical protein